MRGLVKVRGVERPEHCTGHCTLYITHCTLCNVQCTLYTTQCPVHGVECTLYGPWVTEPWAPSVWRGQAHHTLQSCCTALQSHIHCMVHCSHTYTVWCTAVTHTLYGALQSHIHCMVHCSHTYTAWCTAVTHTLYGAMQHCTVGHTVL